VSTFGEKLQELAAGEMSKRERDDLMKLATKRATLAKKRTEVRAAELMADFERQMATIYKWDDDELWSNATEAAEEALREADSKVAERCEELGIPAQFRPKIGGVAWYGRGENASKERQAELRRVARTEIDRLIKAAKEQIETGSLEVQEKILLGGFDSAGARAFLEAMPTPEALMPTLDASAIDARLIDNNNRLRLGG